MDPHILTQVEGISSHYHILRNVTSCIDQRHSHADMSYKIPFMYGTYFTIDWNLVSSIKLWKKVISINKFEGEDEQETCSFYAIPALSMA